jgi:hypothetical protein
MRKLLLLAAPALALRACVALLLLPLAAGCLTSPFDPPSPPEGSGAPTTDPKARERAITAVRKRGGIVRTDTTEPDKKLVAYVNLHDFHNVGAALDSLWPLTKLQELNVYNTQFGDGDLERLRGLAGLQVLNLNSTRVTDAGLGVVQTLPALRVLAVNDTQVSDAGLQALAGLKNLRELSLFRTQVTDQGLAQVAALKDLTKLNLGGGNITDRGLAYLKRLRNLRELGLYSTRVTPAAIADFHAALPRVRIIH